MHEYYEKNRDRFGKTMKGFLSLVAGEIESDCGEPFETAFAGMWSIYKCDMLARFPYIGGDKAGGTKNLTEAYMLVAMGEYLRAHGVELDHIGKLMTLAYERRMLKIPKLLRRAAGKMFSDKKLLRNMLTKKDAKNAANAAMYPGSFVTKVLDTPEDGYDFSYHYLVCPLADFAKKYGYEEYMPYLCNLDYVMFGVLGVPLFREHTCAVDGYCDFKLKSGAEPMPYDPPVFSQGKGFR